MKFLSAITMESWSIQRKILLLVNFVVRLYLLLEIYLLYIQFIVDLSLA